MSELTAIRAILSFFMSKIISGLNFVIVENLIIKKMVLLFYKCIKQDPASGHHNPPSPAQIKEDLLLIYSEISISVKES